MRSRTRSRRSAALAQLASTVFATQTFSDVLTGIGIVATRWELERPMIFKGASQAHGRRATFVPGFGCTIADAVRASCSAYPFFKKTVVTTNNGNQVELLTAATVPTTRRCTPSRMPSRLSGGSRRNCGWSASAWSLSGAGFLAILVQAALSGAPASTEDAQHQHDIDGTTTCYSLRRNTDGADQRHVRTPEMATDPWKRIRPS